MDSLHSKPPWISLLILGMNFESDKRYRFNGIHPNRWSANLNTTNQNCSLIRFFCIAVYKSDSIDIEIVLLPTKSHFGNLDCADFVVISMYLFTKNCIWLVCLYQQQANFSGSQRWWPPPLDVAGLLHLFISLKKQEKIWTPFQLVQLNRFTKRNNHRTIPALPPSMMGQKFIDWNEPIHCQLLVHGNIPGDK